MRIKVDKTSDALFFRLDESRLGLSPFNHHERLIVALLRPADEALGIAGDGGRDPGGGQMRAASQ